MLRLNKPIEARNQAPCFSCSMNYNNQGLKCFQFCDKLRFWCEIKDAQRAHIRKQEVALSPRAEKEKEEMLREMEQTVNKHVKEFKSALEESGVLPEREEYSDEELEMMADEILAGLEEEDEG